MLLPLRNPRDTNYDLWKTEQDFLKGKKYPEIKVEFRLVNGSVIAGPIKLSPAKESGADQQWEPS